MIRKLKYIDKEEAIAHLIKIGVIVVQEDEDLGIQHREGRGVKGIVHLPPMVETKGTYTDEGKELTPTTLIEGYHVDVVLVEDVDFDFGNHEIFPKKPKHVILK